MNQIVANINGRDVTRGELSTAFDLVADRSNWKNPISALVNLTDSERDMVAGAVVFFTGSVASFEAISHGTMQHGLTRYRVRAAGYYRAIGA